MSVTVSFPPQLASLFLTQLGDIKLPPFGINVHLSWHFGDICAFGSHWADNTLTAALRSPDLHRVIAYMYILFYLWSKDTVEIRIFLLHVKQILKKLRFVTWDLSEIWTDTDASQSHLFWRTVPTVSMHPFTHTWSLPKTSARRGWNTITSRHSLKGLHVWGQFFQGDLIKLASG